MVVEVDEEMPKLALGQVPLPGLGPGGSSEVGEELTFGEWPPGRHATRVFSPGLRLRANPLRGWETEVNRSSHIWAPVLPSARRNLRGEEPRVR